MQGHGGHALRPRPSSTASCAAAASSAGRGSCGRCRRWGRRAHTGQPGVDPGATAWTGPGTGLACSISATLTKEFVSISFQYIWYNIYIYIICFNGISSNFQVLLKGEPCHWLGGVSCGRCKPWHSCSRCCNTSRSIKLHHGNNNRPPSELGTGMKENMPVRANLVDCELWNGLQILKYQARCTEVSQNLFGWLLCGRWWFTSFASLSGQKSTSLTRRLRPAVLSDQKCQGFSFLKRWDSEL